MRRALLCAVLLGGCFAEAPPLPANYTDPGQRSHAFVTVEKDHDEDYSADPKPKTEDASADSPEVDEARRASFAAAGAGLVAQTKYVNRDPIPFDQALKCLGLQQDAIDKAPACAAEILVGNCSRGDNIRQSECPDCYALNKADRALSQAGCQARPKYPPLREQ